MDFGMAVLFGDLNLKVLASIASKVDICVCVERYHVFECSKIDADLSVATL